MFSKTKDYNIPTKLLLVVLAIGNRAAVPKRDPLVNIPSYQ